MKATELLIKILSDSTLSKKERLECFGRYPWLVSILGVLLPEGQLPEKAEFAFQIVKTREGFFYNSPTEGWKPLEGPKDNLPLLTPSTPITVNRDCFEVLEEDAETHVGNVIAYAVIIESTIPGKLPFNVNKYSMGYLDRQFAKRLKDTPAPGEERDPRFIYVDEFIAISDRLEFITCLGELINVAATSKTIVPPPGIDQFRAKVLKKYEGQLHDPVAFTKVEEELKAYAREYLKDDPTLGRIMSGKVMNVAWTKMMLIFGSEQGFEETSTINPVTKSLYEGLDTSEEKFPDYMNALRSGSYSRGSETVNGGVVSKGLLRSIGSVLVNSTPCSTQVGYKIPITEANHELLLGRSIRVNDTWIEIPLDAEDTNKYVGTTVELRSALFCLSEKGTYCSKCLDANYEGKENAIAISELEVSATILNMFMKKMHGKVLKTVEVSLDELFN